MSDIVKAFNNWQRKDVERLKTINSSIGKENNAWSIVLGVLVFILMVIVFAGIISYK